jgi:predicted SprT family Zn-dependent metalloprotease
MKVEVGAVFGMLTVKRRSFVSIQSSGQHKFECECRCGALVEKTRKSLAEAHMRKHPMCCDECKIDRDVYLPTQEEIAAMTAQIRAENDALFEAVVPHRSQHFLHMYRQPRVCRDHRPKR